MKANNKLINRDSDHFFKNLWIRKKWSLSLFILLSLISPLGAKSDSAQEDQIVEESPKDKISLDLKNVDIVELLRIVSLKTGRTIVPSKDVSGRITIYLSQVAFDDVLDIILLTQGLALNKKDNVYYVMSEAEYKKMYGRDYIDQRKIETVKLSYAKPSIIFNALGQLKSDVGKIVVDEASGTIILIDIPEKLELLQKTIKELDQPLTTAIYDLNYIKPADAKTQLNAAITPGTGEVIIDERNGKAIISDLPRKIDKLGMLVREIDEESRQVYIEADIVELTLDNQFQRGIDWEKLWSSAAMNGLDFSGNFPLAALTAVGAITQKISVGTFATNHYQAILNFLNTYGTTHVVSQPRIAVVNNEEANIMVGTREAYITQTQSQATATTVTSETVEFIDVGVKLKVVPKISADDFITMKIKPEVSSVTRTLTTSLGSVVPIVQTSQSESVVKIKDGMMIMIAGMTKVEKTDTINGWPVLSKIPFLGVLFSNRVKDTKRTEVIIFLTPHLSRGDAGLRGDEITKILPMENLPERLQNKVVRDKAIDKGLFTPEKMKEELAKKQAIEVAAEETAERTAADKLAKAAEKAEKAAVKQTVAAEVKKSSPREAAKEYYQKGLRAQADSDNEEAIRNFIRAAQLDKKYAAAYNSLGIIYEQESKPEKSEEMYLKAVSADERYCPAYSNLALFNENRKDFTKALEYWRKRVLYGDQNSEWTKKAIQRIKELESNKGETVSDSIGTGG
ncbi:MAG: secretin N-terminal domain-containing protein [Candidatus Omnitrophica bacterium]|nr:secretin N-terminal domain-containing protein [Candidatus Omnitrophota bacterium]